MPAWVWRDVRSVFIFSLLPGSAVHGSAVPCEGGVGACCRAAAHAFVLRSIEDAERVFVGVCMTL